MKEETDRVYAGVGPEGKLTLEYGGKEKGGVEVEIGGFVDGESASSCRFLRLFVEAFLEREVTMN